MKVKDMGHTVVFSKVWRNKEQSVRIMTKYSDKRRWKNNRLLNFFSLRNYFFPSNIKVNPIYFQKEEFL